MKDTKPAGSGKIQAQSAPLKDSIRKWVRNRIRKYPSGLFRGTPSWEKDDLKGLTEEFLSFSLPSVDFMIFSGAPPKNVFNSIKQELSDFMMESAPSNTRKFINQVSGLLKPKYGFTRRIKKGIGFSSWNSDTPITSCSRAELFQKWKKEKILPPGKSGYEIKARDRVKIFKGMIESANGWVPKSWFYNGFLQLGGFSSGEMVGGSSDLAEQFETLRPRSFEDFEKIRELKIIHGEQWEETLKNSLEALSGKARVIFLRLLLYGDNQVEAAKQTGTSPQYVFKIFQKIKKSFESLMPLSDLEMKAFKSFFQEYLFSVEKKEERERENFSTINQVERK